MAEVTSKLQVTVPKMLARQFGIRPGDTIDWVAAEDAIRIVPAKSPARLAPETRLKLFDDATHRQRRARRPRSIGDRGWTREDLHDRHRSR